MWRCELTIVNLAILYEQDWLSDIQFIFEICFEYVKLMIYFENSFSSPTREQERLCVNRVQIRDVFKAEDSLSILVLEKEQDPHTCMKKQKSTTMLADHNTRDVIIRGILIVWCSINFDRCFFIYWNFMIYVESHFSSLAQEQEHLTRFHPKFSFSLLTLSVWELHSTYVSTTAFISYMLYRHVL